MGFFETLFGGTESESLYSPLQKHLSTSLQYLMNSQLGQGVEAYGGQIVPGATANQRQAFDLAGGLTSGYGGPDVQPAIGQYLSGAPAYNVDPAYSAELFDTAVGAPARQDFGDALQEIDARYGARFGRSGAQLEAAGRAAERFGTGLAGERASWMRADEMDRRAALERGMDRMGAGIGYGMQDRAVGGAEDRANLMALLGVGGAERDIAGQQLGEDYAKWEYSRPYNNPWLGMMGMALTPEPTRQVQKPGILSGALMGAKAGGDLFGGSPWGMAAGALGGGALSGSGWF